jgi:SAM-dependent methyltransferase
MDFNEHKDSYVQTIESSLRMSGKEHDFFIKVKAECLKTIIQQYFPENTIPRLLDIGCGHGLIHKHLDVNKLNIVGVEVAEEVLVLAKKSNPQVRYLAHDGKTLPVDDGQFDIALAICVMHHVPPFEWMGFLKEMKRVLKPNGIALIFEHNPYNPVTRYIVANNILDADAVLLSGQKIKKMLQATGFKQIKNRNILFTPFAHSAFRWVDKVLSKIPLGAQYYSIGRV